VSAASSYVRDLEKSRLDSDEVARFIALLTAEDGKDERQYAVDYLLRVTQLTREQVVSLFTSAPVANAVGLQHSILRYARTKQVESDRVAEDDPIWVSILMMF
jgi:hypothetical protein